MLLGPVCLVASMHPPERLICYKKIVIHLSMVPSRILYIGTVLSSVISHRPNTRIHVLVIFSETKPSEHVDGTGTRAVNATTIVFELNSGSSAPVSESHLEESRVKGA